MGTSLLEGCRGGLMSEPKIRLAYLDGLRGLAAFYVFLNHLYLEIEWRLGKTELPPLVQSACACLVHGRFAVAVFIVLSGYCLMLPIARGNNKSDILDYFKRRGRRILPPYYAALFLSLLLFALVPGVLNSTMGYHWNHVQPAFKPSVLLSHALLIHNFRLDWVYKINGPMWSVATEWQIYFLFPLILLPVWRRFGILAAVCTAFTIGLMPHYLVPDSIDDEYKFLDWAVPWHLGLFSLGMTGALIGFSRKPSLIWLREQLPWNILCLSLIIALATQRFNWQDDRVWLVDALVGAIVACQLIYCTQFLTTANHKQHPLLLQLLNSHWAVLLGTFSYSLYLVHSPLLGIAQLLANSLPVSPVVQLWTFTLLAVPLVLLLSYLFHLAFERQFMHYPRKEVLQ